MPDGESATYRTHYKPWGTAEGERRWISLRSDEDGHLTRRGFDYILVPDQDNSGATVEMTLHHQKRKAADRPWDEEPFDLRHLKNGEALRLTFTSEETLELHQTLVQLHRLGQDGVPRGDRELLVHDANQVVATGELAAWIVSLQEHHSDAEIIAAIQALQPDLLASVAAATRNAQWSSALSVFEEQMAARTWTERQWQAFFEENDWLFGHGLDYHFLTTAVDHPHFGGADVTGMGDQEGDFLMATGGDVRFSVVVEIKKPQTALLGQVQYRNKAWSIGEQLSGGVAQIQAQCERWAKAARSEDNADWAKQTGIKTVQPKGILLIGHTYQLDISTKQDTFHRFRRSLTSPEIMTYDELLARARFMVRRVDSVSTEADVGPTPDQVGWPTTPPPDEFPLDDLPF
jgi:hypothetical protein